MEFIKLKSDGSGVCPDPHGCCEDRHTEKAEEGAPRAPGGHGKPAEREMEGSSPPGPPSLRGWVASVTP